MATPDDDDQPLGRPLPPEDRLWRHPSELAGGPGAPRQQIVLVERVQPSLGRTLVVAAVATVLGAGATLGTILGTGALVRERPGTTSHEVRGAGAGATGANLLAVAGPVLDSVVHLEATGPKGSVNATAVVFRSDGQLLTTADAVDAAEHITVVLPDSRRISSPDVTVVARSITADLAVLKIPVDGLVPAAGSQSPVSRFDHTVVVDASPVTTGPVIAEGTVARDVAEGPPATNGEPMYGLIETLTSTGRNPLGPGSLFLDDRGTVVGILTDRAAPDADAAADTRPPAATAGQAAAGEATATAAEAGDSNVSHFAIPAEHAWAVAAQLADQGQVVAPWVGLPTGAGLTPAEADREGVAGGGMRVTLIEEGSPASTDLRRDDIVVALESQNVADYNTFVTALRRHRVGSVVTLRVLRRGAYEHILLGVGGKVVR